MTEEDGDPAALLVKALLARLMLTTGAATRARLAVALSGRTPLTLTTADLLPPAAEPLPLVVLPAPETPDDH